MIKPKGFQTFLSEDQIIGIPYFCDGTPGRLRTTALSDKCGSYLIWNMQLFWIPIVKTPRKTKVMHFTKKKNNVHTFVNLQIRPIILSVKNTFFKIS